MKTSELMAAAVTAGLPWQQQMYFFGLVFKCQIGFFPPIRVMRLLKTWRNCWGSKVDACLRV